MPYYKDMRIGRLQDWYLNDVNLASNNQSGRFPLEQQRTTGYRTRPVSESSVEVPDYDADPYAYFLSNIGRETYIQNLKDRGIAPADPMVDHGHPFDTLKHTFEHRAATGEGRYRPSWQPTATPRVDYRFSGQALIPQVSSSFLGGGLFSGHQLAPAQIPASDLTNFAQRAISKTAPNRAYFDLGRFLGELKEGLPSLAIQSLKGRLSILKDAGGDYLNYQFGWLPLVSDLKGILDVLRNSSEILQRMPQQGRPIRRSWALPPRIESEQVTSDYAQIRSAVAWIVDPSTPGYFNPSGSGSLAYNAYGNGLVIKRLYRKQWFAGAYTTFLPLGVDFTQFTAQFDLLTKIKWTPQTLWELAPWSWLIDWSSHIGDSIASNELAADKNLHIHYAYAMEHTALEVSSFFDFVPGAAAGEYYLSGMNSDKFYAYSKTVSKRRIRANPYGFTTGGLSGLSAQQIAILAALGLSRT